MSLWHKTILLGLTVSLLAAAPADGFRERVLALYKAGQKAEAEQVLREWETQQPRDPELYILRFNLWLLEASQAREQAGGGLHVAFEQDLARMIESGELDRRNKAERAAGRRADSLYHLATAKLRAGIAVAPERLDMRFGLAKTYEEWQEPAAQVQVLREALAWRASAAGRPWTWREGAVLPQPEIRFVPQALEGYTNHYWQEAGGMGGEAALEPGRQLAELLVQYYPSSSLGPFNLGVYHLVKDEWVPALAQLNKADALQPNDSYTLYNLTRAALHLKRKQEAAGYLARLRRLPGTQEQVAECEQDLQKLR